MSMTTYSEGGFHIHPDRIKMVLDHISDARAAGVGNATWYEWASAWEAGDYNPGKAAKARESLVKQSHDNICSPMCWPAYDAAFTGARYDNGRRCPIYAEPPAEFCWWEPPGPLRDVPCYVDVSRL